MAKQRIGYVPLEAMDGDTRRRAHVKACFWFFANSWYCSSEYWAARKKQTQEEMQ